jgi:hypothetical protein
VSAGRRNAVVGTAAATGDGRRRGNRVSSIPANLGLLMHRASSILGSSKTTCDKSKTKEAQYITTCVRATPADGVNLIPYIKILGME